LRRLEGENRRLKAQRRTARKYHDLLSEHPTTSATSATAATAATRGYGNYNDDGGCGGGGGGGGGGGDMGRFRDMLPPVLPSLVSPSDNEETQRYTRFSKGFAPWSGRLFSDEPTSVGGAVGGADQAQVRRVRRVGGGWMSRRVCVCVCVCVW
jgi:hypothetical protein